MVKFVYVLESIFVLFEPYACFNIVVAAYSAYDMFSKYKYLIVNLLFSRLGLEWDFFFWLRLFLIIAYL